jgi:hypothetical protein
MPTFTVIVIRDEHFSINTHTIAPEEAERQFARIKASKPIAVYFYKDGEIEHGYHSRVFGAGG